MIVPIQLNKRLSKSIAIGEGVLGLLTHLLVGLIGSNGGDAVFILGLMVWSWLPYLIGIFLAVVLRNPIIALCGMIPPLILDATNVYAVFIAPTSSTAALGLLWMPLWNLTIAGPIGIVIGLAISRIWLSPNRI